MRCIKFLFCVAVISFCGCSPSVEVVDLNKVLDVFQATLSELDGDDESVDAAEIEGAEVAAGEEKEKQEQFLATFRTNLNAAKLVASPIGVKMHESGTINGFSDKDNDNVQDSGELELFKVDMDVEGKRLVASDGAGHHRDHTYRRRHGFFTGYMLGSMLNRNRGYYSGARASLKPDYSKTAMSPKTYHKSAVAKAKTAARSSSARSRSGSRGFSFGK